MCVCLGGGGGGPGRRDGLGPFADQYKDLDIKWQKKTEVGVRWDGDGGGGGEMKLVHLLINTGVRVLGRFFSTGTFCRRPQQHAWGPGRNSSSTTYC